VNSSTNSLHASRPPTEVTAKAKRRRFNAEFKRRILQEAEACDRGELGALLRREGLYSSHLTEWRRARDAGELAGLTPRKRGPKVQAPDPLAAKVAEQQKQIARLEAENAKLQIICDVQKKLSQLLGLTIPTIPDDDENSGSSS
jgi:transposase